MAEIKIERDMKLIKVLAAQNQNERVDSDKIAEANQIVAELAQDLNPQKAHELAQIVAFTVDELQKKTTTLMSRCCAVVRDAELIGGFLSEVDSILSSFCSSVRYSEPSQLKRVFRLRDNLIAQKCFAQSMLDYVQQGGKSRGSAICHDNGGIHPYGFLPPEFTYFLDDGSKDSLVQEMSYKDGKCSFNWRKVRPIPHEDDFFENVWRSFRKNGNVS